MFCQSETRMIGMQATWNNLRVKKYFCGSKYTSFIYNSILTAAEAMFVTMVIKFFFLFHSMLFQDSMQRNSGTLDVPLPKPEAQKVS